MFNLVNINELEQHTAALTPNDWFIVDIPNPLSPTGFVSRKINSTLFPTGGDSAWKFPLAAFVDPANGTSGGVVGDGNQPFQTVAQAQAASNLVVLLPGTYSGNIDLADSIEYHCFIGVVFAANSRLRDNGVAIDIKITGLAQFAEDAYGFELTAASNIFIQLLDMDRVRTIVNSLATSPATVYIKARNINCTTDNGAGVATFIRGGALVIIDCDQFYVNHWGAAPGTNTSGTPNRFILRCPDVRILNGGWAGNVAKSLINGQGSVSTDFDFYVDLRGGKLINEHAVQTTSFGALDSAFLLFVNSTNALSVPKITLKNGTVEANAFFGICHHFACTVGTLIIENVKVKSNTRAFNFYLSNFAGNGNRVKNIFRNCVLESTLANRIGNAQELYADNTRLIVTGDGQTSLIDYDNQNPADLLQAFFTDVLAELANSSKGTGVLISNSPAAATLYGMLNTYSSEAIGTNVTDTWGGFQQVPTLKIAND